jgi:hypothetical protein
MKLSLVFGDGHLKRMGNHARFSLGMKDKEFVQLVWGYFNSLGIVGAPPIENKSIIKPSGNTRLSYLFNTFTLPLFTDLHSQWYKRVDGKNIKIIPENIADLLTARAIA